MMKNSKILWLVLIVVLLGVYIILYYSFQPKSPPAPVDTGLTDAQKESFAQAMNERLKNIPPLTDKQKEDIAKKMLESLSK